ESACADHGTSPMGCSAVRLRRFRQRQATNGRTENLPENHACRRPPRARGSDPAGAELLSFYPTPSYGFFISNFPRMRYEIRLRDIVLAQLFGATLSTRLRRGNPGSKSLLFERYREALRRSGWKSVPMDERRRRTQVETGHFPAHIKRPYQPCVGGG